MVGDQRDPLPLAEVMETHLGVIPHGVGVGPLEVVPQHVEHSHLVVLLENPLDRGKNDVLVVVVLDLADRFDAEHIPR